MEFPAVIPHHRSGASHRMTRGAPLQGTPHIMGLGAIPPYRAERHEAPDRCTPFEKNTNEEIIHDTNIDFDIHFL